MVVDNRPGAGGVIAADLTAKAPPDGYTLIMCTVASCATNVSLHKNLPYHPLRDFEPVTLSRLRDATVEPIVGASIQKPILARLRGQIP